MPKLGDLRIVGDFMPEYGNDVYHVEAYLPRIGRYSMKREHYWSCISSGMISAYVNWFPSRQEAACWMAKFMDEIERYMSWYIRYARAIGWVKGLDGKGMDERLNKLYDRGCGPTKFEINYDLDWRNY